MPGTATSPRVKSPKTRKEQAEEAQNKILSAALKTFAHFGFEGASVQQIAHLADMSVPLVIYHFKNKEQLWQATIERAVQDFDAKIGQLNQQQDLSGTEALKQIIDALVQVSADFPEFHQLMTRENHRESNRLDWLAERFLHNHFQTFIRLIKKAQSEGTVRNIPPDRLSHAIVGMATIFSQAAEFKKLTNKDLFADEEIQTTIDSIHQLVFID